MQNRRKTIVVNKKFQYQYSLMVVALAILLVNLSIFARLLLPGQDPFTLTTQSATVIAVVELLLLAGVWYGSLTTSHKIAGPMFVFSRELARVGEGDLTTQIKLRPSDMFQDVAEDINASLSKLHARISSIKGISQQLQDAKDDESGELLSKLHQELSLITTEDS
ncbi:MAG: methyl-accepting chemotaxis protein [Halieaceae bacterium]|jgi:methyl-accepting chemotaxis protein|nr:methyl-accepting chemotaxis protein [Halieaceae bacterium]